MATPAIKKTKELPNAPVCLNISKAMGDEPSEQISIMVANIKVITNPTIDGPKNCWKKLTGIKAFAKEANIAIIALSQLSRDIEKRQDKRPVLSDLRESGEIEQTADLILFIHRHEETSPETSHAQDYSNVQLVIAKHRNGPTGVLNLGFRKKISTFVSVVQSSQSSPPIPTPVW